MKMFSGITGPCARFVDWSATLTRSLMHGAKYAAKRAVVIFGLIVVVLWISVLLYATFYHIYVPAASVIRPAHFKFRVCSSGSGMCSFPVANVTLCTDNQAEIFGKGQKYRVMLLLHVPDSDANRDIGMFMVVSKLYDRYGLVAQESSRAVSLKFQSDLLKRIQTVVLSPLYITGLLSGFAEQAQTLSVELFDSYWDDFYQPAVGALLEIHSRHLTFYSSQLEFHARYAGLRYYLFHYPLSSAFLGILFNCTWLAMAFTLTWYKLGLELLEGSFNGLKAEKMKAVDTWPPQRRLNPVQNPGIIEGVDCRDEEEADEEEEAPRSYVQPFTMTVSARLTETVGRVSDGPEIVEDNTCLKKVAGDDREITEDTRRPSSDILEEAEAVRVKKDAGEPERIMWEAGLSGYVPSYAMMVSAKLTKSVPGLLDYLGNTKVRGTVVEDSMKQTAEKELASKEVDAEELALEMVDALEMVGGKCEDRRVLQHSVEEDCTGYVQPFTMIVPSTSTEDREDTDEETETMKSEEKCQLRHRTKKGQF